MPTREKLKISHNAQGINSFMSFVSLAHSEVVIHVTFCHLVVTPCSHLTTNKAGKVGLREKLGDTGWGLTK